MGSKTHNILYISAHVTQFLTFLVERALVRSQKMVCEGKFASAVGGCVSGQINCAVISESDTFCNTTTSLKIAERKKKSHKKVTLQISQNLSQKNVHLAEHKLSRNLFEHNEVSVDAFFN